MAKAFYIPDGTKNLGLLFSSIDFEQVAEYYVELLDTAGTVVATTPLTQVCGCDDDEDQIRLHFLNYLGTIDAMNFKLREKEHEPTSELYEKPVSYPLDRSQHSVNRFNVKSNDVHRAVSIYYNEEHMDWIDELFDSPTAWMEWAGGQGQPAGFIPVVIIDKKSFKQKVDDRFVYQVEIEFKLSHEKITIRN